MAQKDPYSLLGVSRDAGDAEIKRAFRKKARQYHPDRNPDDAAAEAKFKEIQEAYDTIGTAKERNEYEQQQRMSSMFGGGGGPRGGAGMDDMLRQMFGGGGAQSFGGMGVWAADNSASALSPGRKVPTLTSASTSLQNKQSKAGNSPSLSNG